jgi:hypothetical protein
MPEQDEQPPEEDENDHNAETIDTNTYLYTQG